MRKRKQMIDILGVENQLLLRARPYWFRRPQQHSLTFGLLLQQTQPPPLTMKKTAEKAENLLGIAVTIRIKFNSTIMATMPFYLFLATMVEIAVPAAATQKLICGLIHKDQDKKMSRAKVVSDAHKTALLL